MNANVENVVMEVVINDAVALTDTKSKRVAKPKLPAKLERSMIFGFWFANLLLRGQFIGDETLATMYDKLKIYESLENQTELYNIFESEMNATQKTLRKSIADYHKPPKAPRASKKPAVDGQVAAQKKGRKKKTTEVVVDNNDDFITQLVAVANSGVDAVNTIQNVVVDQSVCATVVTSEVVSKTTKPKKKVVAKPVESVSVLIPETVQAVEVTQNIIIPLNSTGVPESKTEMKTKKTSAIQKVNELLATVAPIAVSEKKPRKKAEPKSTVVETVVATVTEPVVVATVTEPVVVATVTEPIATEVKEKVPRKVESQKGKAEREKKEKKEKKEKVVKEKAEPKLKKVEPPAVVTVVKPVETVIATTVLILDDDDDQSQHTRKLDESDQDDDEEEEEIHAREFVYNDKQYLIDENSNEIYDFTTQDLIGQYDPITKNIQFYREP